MLDADEYEFLEEALADLARFEVRLHALVEFAAETGASLTELAMMTDENPTIIRDIAWRALLVGRGEDARRVYVSDRAMAYLPWIAFPREDELDDLRIAWALQMKPRNAPIDLDAAISELHRHRDMKRAIAADEEVPF